MYLVKNKITLKYLEFSYKSASAKSVTDPLGATEFQTKREAALRLSRYVLSKKAMEHASKEMNGYEIVDTADVDKSLSDDIETLAHNFLSGDEED